MAKSQAHKLSREDFKRQKAIDERRREGTLPAEIDPETGKDINPHIPHYLSQAPWYLDINHPTLKHQKSRRVDESKIENWYQRGVVKGPPAKKFRKGSCENCGAMTHLAKDCVERPRKIGARWTGRDIMPDEKIAEINLNFEAKRDRWNGYDPEEHSKLIKDWELVEKERAKAREKQLREKEAKKLCKSEHELNKEDSEDPFNILKFDSENDSDVDEDKYADSADMPGQKLDTKTRTTVRNLRIREDTAKYLLNLNVGSSYYDPKTRSMREDPNADKGPKDQIYRGDNFQRYTGDAPELNQLQVFAWEAESWGEIVHVQANPTEAEIVYKEYKEKKQEYSKKIKDSILERYGGEEHIKAPPKELLLAQTEVYVEYSQTGRQIKAPERVMAKSRYMEDVHFLNHSSVWGSWWSGGKWGFACCHSQDRDSYCKVIKAEK